MNFDTEAVANTAIRVSKKFHSAPPNVISKSAMLAVVEKYALELDRQRNTGVTSDGDLLPTLVSLTRYSNILKNGAEIFICGYEDNHNIYAYHLVNDNVITHHVKKY